MKLAGNGASALLETLYVPSCSGNQDVMTQDGSSVPLASNNKDTWLFYLLPKKTIKANFKSFFFSLRPRCLSDGHTSSRFLLHKCRDACPLKSATPAETSCAASDVFTWLNRPLRADRSNFNRLMHIFKVFSFIKPWKWWVMLKKLSCFHIMTCSFASNDYFWAFQ